MSTDTKTQTRAFVWGYNNRGGLGTGSVAHALHPVPARLPAKTIDLQGGADTCHPAPTRSRPRARWDEGINRRVL